MPTRFWEMAAGCLLFLGFQKRASIEKLLGKVPPLLVLTLIVAIMYLPMSWATVSTVLVVALTLVLIASLKKETTAYKFFTNPKIVYIGLISYSLYLWHWSVLSISRWTVGIHWWSVPFQVALMFGFAIASYRYIETPLRKGHWFGKRWKTLVLGGGVIVILSGGVTALGGPLKGQLFTGKKRITTKSSSPLLRGDKCLENISENTKCFLIDNNSNQTLWMFGDSHTKYLYATGERLTNHLGLNMRGYNAGGTPFPPVGHYRKVQKKSDLQSLEDFRSLEKELYKQVKAGDIILLSMRMPYHFGGTYYDYKSSDFRFVNEDGSFGSQENYFDNWIDSVRNLANITQKKGVKVIIQTPTPEWKKETKKECSNKNIQWFNVLQKKNCQIESKFFIDKDKGLYKHLFEKLNNLAISHENIYLFDTYKVVCPESTCSFTENNVDIYHDDDHLSKQWARDFLAPEISKFIKRITD